MSNCGWAGKKSSYNITLDELEGVENKMLEHSLLLLIYSFLEGRVV